MFITKEPFGVGLSLTS